MCGIVGVMSSRGGATREALVAMTAELHHRGPDHVGHWLDDTHGIALGHARLSIVELSANGHQPMASASERYVLVFNGEIYNHTALREELDANGIAPKWRGHSDTETLTAGFDAWGVNKTVERAMGMFAFAVWDRRERTLTLARDRMGEKPLFYGFQSTCFVFGSELKALRAHPSFETKLDPAAVSCFIRFGYVPAPLSIYASIRKLPPGTLVTIKLGESASMPKPYWSFMEIARGGVARPFQGTEEEAIDQLESVLSNAVAGQQMSDVPLGAFLSGGIDSSLIVALMQARSTRPIHTVTIGFDNPSYNEAPQARAVAEHLGTHHSEVLVTPREALDVIASLPRLYDEPFADSSQIPTYLVSQAARRRVTVALSGDGGDELFGGYNRYLVGQSILRLPRAIRQRLGKGLYSISPAMWDRYYSAAQPLLPKSFRMQAPGDKAHKLAAILDTDSASVAYSRLVSMWREDEPPLQNPSPVSTALRVWNDVGDLGSDTLRMMAVDALTYLPDDILCKVDRASMAVSLETRVPFLDPQVVEFAWQLPLHMKIRGRQGKWILRQLLYRYVPRELVERPKMGFGVPVGEWLCGPLRDWAESLLSEERLRSTGFLDPGPIRARWAEHLSQTHNWQYALWHILMFQSWTEQWL